MSKYNAWNPGVGSDIPPHLRPLITLFSVNNSKVSFVEATEAAEFCGLKASQMCEPSLERLIIHELLIRVTGDISVPDGPNYEDLGISLRSITDQILSKHVMMEIGSLSFSFDTFMEEAQSSISKLISEELMHSSSKSIGSFKSKGLKFASNSFKYLLNSKIIIAEKEKAFSNYYEQKTNESLNLESDCSNCVSIILNGILKTHGRIIYDKELLVKLTVRLFRNIYGSQKVGELISPIFYSAVEAEGYKLLPPQLKPMVMNTKGASASGKSTIRPQQRLLAERMEIRWDEFALISPDYWRKFLLDYDSLGSDYKYAAMLTGYELEIIDKKLDLYMEIKAEKNEMPHLLIDRFRFDSFRIDSEGGYQSKLLSRFGQKVLLFFVITPPQETVERAWVRALSTSRYKAVEDLLFHNIEAYTGMPELFFSWMGIKDKDINFEFLDNTVPLGETPKTIAFGKTDEMYILDLVGLNNIDLFKEVNVGAKCSEDVLIEKEIITYDFLKQCFLNFNVIYLINSNSKRIYAVIKKGAWIYKDKRSSPSGRQEHECLSALGWDAYFSKNEVEYGKISKIVNFEQTLGS